MTGSDPLLTAIGRVLRSLRLQRSLKQSELARMAGTSTAVISRLESGVRLPRDGAVVRLLDDGLEAGGELQALWRAALEGRQPGATDPARRWVHNYPAPYHGIVWMRVSAGDRTAAAAELELRWGPWVLRRTLRWPKSRVVDLWHTKGDDGLSIPLIVRSTQPILVEFHLGEPPEHALDINPGWENDDL